MRQLVCNMFVSNNRASFPMWWEENLIKYQKVSNYYQNDCGYCDAIQDRNKLHKKYVENIQTKIDSGAIP